MFAVGLCTIVITTVFVGAIEAVAGVALRNWLLGVVGVILFIGGTVSTVEMVMGRFVETKDVHKQIVALDRYDKPMYDVINNSDSTSYKIYLKSGGTKTVSPKIVHVTKSTQSYLKTETKQIGVNFFGLKVNGQSYDNTTLYLNDKK